MSSVTAKLAKILSTVRQPGDFFVSGKAAISVPRLDVEGVGVVALPLLPSQAEHLIAVADRAPFGRGEHTLVDTQVRRTWQIGADRVRLKGQLWERSLETILARVADGLGVAGAVAAEFYKLLVYDEGSFFLSHRDTEKVPGMFATLVVVLPSTSEGGELVIRHESREVQLDLRSTDPSEAAFAAFYADCVHEVRPVTRGCRLTLVYNLVRRGREPAPKPPSYERERDQITTLLRTWAAPGRPPRDEPQPVKLIYPLQHAYSPVELAFDALKGADAAVATVVAAAAPPSGCDLHLALMSVEESGAAEYDESFSRRRGRSYVEENFEAGDVDERRFILAEWRRPDGSKAALGELPFGEGELSPPDAFEKMKPDEEHFHEATGNEGATFERSYRRAALVLWPQRRFFAVLSQGGLEATLPWLEELTDRRAAAGEGHRSALAQEARALARQIIADWPQSESYPSREGSAGNAARMLGLLMRLEDVESTDAFLSKVASRGATAKGDNDAVVGALNRLPPARAAALLRGIVNETAALSFSTSADLLARAAAALPQGRLAGFRDAVLALIEALPGPPEWQAVRSSWQRDPGVEARSVVDLFTALKPLDPALAERASDHILAFPTTYDLDTVLVPALRELVGSGGKAPLAQRLRAACLGHLRTRIGRPLEPPQDWRRANKLACQCPHCSELSRFLDDPGRRIWTFKAAQEHRNHVQRTVSRDGCDLDIRTERRGSPHSLVCTKNQATYERLVRQRATDLTDLERLEA